LWQVFRQYATCQEFGIFIRCQWDIELRPVETVWNMCCKVLWRAECHRQ
jgi:hypothetical protein